MAAAVTVFDSPSRRQRLLRTWSSLRASSRLGWEVSSNWTRPLPFFIYTVLRPVSLALILAVMYSVISGGRPQTRPYLAFLVVGTAFWSFVQNGLADFANGIAEDRQRYQMLKYVYIAPPHFYLYLLGRVGAQLATAVASVVIVLGLASLVLHLPIDPRRVNYPLLLASSLLAFGVVTAAAMAFCVALLGVRDSYGYGEIVAASLYIFSGAIFPISVLPPWLAAIASLSPLVYWLELVRRALLGPHAILMFPHLSDWDVLLRLALTTLAVAVLAHLFFRWGDHRARAQGYIDRVENF